MAGVIAVEAAAICFECTAHVVDLDVSRVHPRDRRDLDEPRLAFTKLALEAMDAVARERGQLSTLTRTRRPGQLDIDSRGPRLLHAIGLSNTRARAFLIHHLVRTMHRDESHDRSPDVDQETTMHKPVDIGRDRTGIATSQGTAPRPGTVEGVLKSIVEKIEGDKATMLIDKLGERLAFERSLARLYDALLAKYEAAYVHDGGPTRQQLEQMRDDEIRHFALVRDALLELGADPTAMTPSADVIAGWVQVLTDPRSTLAQCLVVMLSAEVADGEGWELLVSLTESLGFDELAEQFRLALIEEEHHALTVRAWVTRSVLGQSGATSGSMSDDRAI